MVSVRFAKTRATDLSLFSTRLLEKSIQDQSPADNDNLPAVAITGLLRKTKVNWCYKPINHQRA